MQIYRDTLLTVAECSMQHLTIHYNLTEHFPLDGHFMRYPLTNCKAHTHRSVHICVNASIWQAYMVKFIKVKLLGQGQVRILNLNGHYQLLLQKVCRN